MLLGGAPALAAPGISETTPCDAVVGAFDAKDSGAMGQIAAVTQRVMSTIDANYAEKLPATEKWRGNELGLMVATTASACQQHPAWALARAVKETYAELTAIAAIRAGR